MVVTQLRAPARALIFFCLAASHPDTLFARHSGKLLLSARTLAFQAESGSATIQRQSFTAQSTPEQWPVEASVRYLGATRNWLSISPDLSNGRTRFTVSANPAGLAPGSYIAHIELAAQGSEKPEPAVTVTLEIVSTSPATMASGGIRQAVGITAAPSSLEFSSALSENPWSLSYQVTLSGPTPKRFTVRTSPFDWLTVWPSSGTTPATIYVTARNGTPAAWLRPGFHPGAITVVNAENGEQLSIPTHLNVTGNTLFPRPDRLSFTHISRHPRPVSQTLFIGSPFANSYAASTDAAWLSVTPPSGPAFAEVSVSADASQLAPGTYAATITLKDFWTTLKVPVTFQVVPPPVLTLSPSALQFSAAAGIAAPATQAISVGSSGLPIRFTLTAENQGKKWLSAQSSSTSTPATISVIPFAEGLPAGIHCGTVTVKEVDGSQSRTIEVALAVTKPVPMVRGLLHAGTLRSTAVSPGLVVTLLGDFMGPETGALAGISESGLLPSILAGTRILFDGMAAPLLFANGRHVNAIVPYAVAGRASTQVQVEAEGVRSQPLELRVADAAPGLFTIDSSGLGQAAALNQDGTVNSPANPEAADRAVILFGTGEGLTHPAGQDGRITGLDLGRPLLPVSATVGGVPVEVLYAGSAPGTVAGVLQVNLLLNGKVPSGSAVPVEIRVGSAPSLSGVSIAVR